MKQEVNNLESSVVVQLLKHFNNIVAVLSFQPDVHVVILNSIVLSLGNLYSYMKSRKLGTHTII